MATLQKFKLLATQCAVIGSPARSPTTSPVIHIRRRKTLRMLLSRRTANNADVFHRRFLHPNPRPEKTSVDKRPPETAKDSNLGVRLKLKDLFVSSPPPPAIIGDNSRKVPEEDEGQRLLPATGTSSGGGLAVARRVSSGGASIRPLSATLRQRLLMRRMWRPVLVAIPEQSP